VLFVSKDGSTAYTQLGAHIYRFNLLDNSGVPVIQNANILGVSPDGKYLISTDAPFGDKTPLYTIYDVSANPIRFVNHFTPINIWGNRALWIDGGKFALTHEDSLGYTHVSIWDTTNTLVNTLSDADASEATGSYSPGSQALFVRNRAAGIDRIIQPTQSNFIRSSVLSQDSSESMDASADGKLLAYCSAKYSQTYALFAINVQNGHTASLGGSALALFLSPNGDRVAYTHADGANITIQVAGISLPQ
jgi:hypothetical protein